MTFARNKTKKQKKNPFNCKNNICILFFYFENDLQYCPYSNPTKLKANTLKVKKKGKPQIQANRNARVEKNVKKKIEMYIVHILYICIRI